MDDATTTPASAGPKRLFPPTGPVPTRRLDQTDLKPQDSPEQRQIQNLQKQVTELTDLIRTFSAPPGDPSAPPGESAPPGDPSAPHGDPSAPPGDPSAPHGDRSAPPGDPSAPPGDPESDSDSDPESDLTETAAPDKTSTELLAMYLLQAMEPAQHSTSGSRYTTTASLLEAWHHKINPEARKALQETICSPGPAAAQGLLTYQNELKAAIAPEKETISAMTISALTREPNHQRALHTENLLAIACGCANLKNLKTKITGIRQTGNYNLDDIPTGPLNRTASFRKFLPAYKRSHTWWQALLDLIASFWGSEAAYCEDDLKAELAWRAADLTGASGGTFARGEDTATTLIAREAQLYKAREIAARGKPFCIPMERARNLLAAAGHDLTEQLLNHLQIKELELERLTWGELTSELVKTDRAILDRRKTMGFLSGSYSPIKTEPLDTHKGNRPKLGNTDVQVAPDDGDCWNHMYLGTCNQVTCPRKHPGPPGSRKHLLANPEGFCKRFLQGTCDRGEHCKFKHEAEDAEPDDKMRERQKILAENRAARAAGTMVF